MNVSLVQTNTFPAPAATDNQAAPTTPSESETAQATAAATTASSA